MSAKGCVKSIAAKVDGIRVSEKRPRSHIRKRFTSIDSYLRRIVYKCNGRFLT